MVTTDDNMRFESDLAEITRPISHYDGCTGYDPGFLTTLVPLPELTEEQRGAAARNRAAGADTDMNVLPYTHFSVTMNRARRLAWYTAVNIDGADLVALPRERDRWYFDPRLPEAEQIGEEVYRRNALDRGHLVRRLDPVWGAVAARSAEDTFHFTNCAPQHERFNQGSDLWQGLENYILRNADIRQRRMSVFTGPVLDGGDPIYKGVRLPLAYWKIVAYVHSSGRLAVAAYLLEQAALIDDLTGLEAAFAAGTYRVTLALLHERTGLDFDYLAVAELPVDDSGLERAADRVRIDTGYANVVL